MRSPVPQASLYLWKGEAGTGQSLAADQGWMDGEAADYHGHGVLAWHVMIDMQLKGLSYDHAIQASRSSYATRMAGRHDACIALAPDGGLPKTKKHEMAQPSAVQGEGPKLLLPGASWATGATRRCSAVNIMIIMHL